MSTDTHRLNEIRHALFNTTAPRYQSLIMPAFGPLAAELVAKADLQPDEIVLDLGAGIGGVTLQAGAIARQAVGVDYAPAMLPIAQKQKAQNQALRTAFYQGDMYRLPHPAQTFDVALASFGFNGVDPARVFPETLRVLRPGGRLLFQEWGQVEEASRIVKAAVKTNRVKQAEGFLADLRLLGAAPKPWDKLNDGETLAQFLRQVGFHRVNFWLEQAAIPFDPRKFFRYKTAWAPYQAELNALSEAERAAVEDSVVEQLNAWAEADGRFIWRPQLLRVMAWKV